MSTADIERIFDRERIRKSLKRWRIFGVLAILAGLACAASFYDSDGHTNNHIARLNITGMITGDDETLQRVRDIAKSETAKALIIRIDSPGGTTAGSEALYLELRQIAKNKPVVAVMDTVAASGGYIAAIAADQIIARGNTITGSIGVIFSFPEVSELMARLGIKMEEIKSGELKAEPTPFKPVSDKVRAVSNEMVQDSFQWFIDLVKERRNMAEARVRILADGRVYTGRQAVKAGLIDQIGGEEEARNWLESKKSIPPNLPIETWVETNSYDTAGFGFSIANRVLNVFGLDILQNAATRSKLDGLLVLWHPQL
jgi:protease IV